MKTDNKTSRNFNSIIFTKAFKFIFIFVICLILLCSAFIDYAMIITAKQKNVFYTENSMNQISKKIALDNSITESISKDEHLKLMLRQFTKESYLGQLKLSRQISDLLGNYTTSSPEVSNISLYTTMPCEFNYQSIYPLNNFAGSEWYNCFNIDGITLFDNFSESSTVSNTPNKDKIIIICPMSISDINFKWYVCTFISKDYLYNTYLHLEGTGQEYLILNNHGDALFAQPFTTTGSQFKHQTISDMVHFKKSNSKIILHNKKLYLATCSQTNDYGWKLFDLKPLSMVITWRGILIGGTLALALLFLYLCYRFSNIFAEIIASPLNNLSKSMKTASTVECENVPSAEILDLYNDYNELIHNQHKLLSEINTQQQKTLEAEMRALISQINPHFLYNTLNVVSWKALDANCPDICTIISKLGKLCQLNYKFKSTYCTLQDEIVSISLYMDLQKDCFNNSFDYKIDIPDEAATLTVPKFILQPIVENSIIHGFAQKSFNGRISVTATADSNLTIVIKDNGMGIDKDILKKLNSGNYFSEKYGIRNIDERIKLSCGEEYGLTFSSHPMSGTTVTFTLPKKYREDM